MEPEQISALFESMGRLYFTIESRNADIGMLNQVVQERDKQIATLQESLVKQNPPQTAEEIPKVAPITPDVPL